MMTGTLTIFLPLLCSLLFGVAALGGGGAMLAQNKERGMAIGVLVFGLLCVLGTLVAGAAAVIFMALSLRNM